jgi:hypothetical protein
MKSSILPLALLILILTGCSASSSTAKKEQQAARYEQTSALIENGNYQFTARSANPSGARTIQITSTYTFEVKEGIYKAYLPYFGRSHTASYGGDGGVEFEGEPANLSITKDDKKMTVSVKFQIKNNDETYDCIFVVTGGGNGTLTVNSSKRTAVSYNGSVNAL